MKRLVLIYLVAFVPLAFVLWIAAMAARAPAEAQGTYGYLMRAAEFNAIAARLGCKPEAVDGELVGTAATRVAECLQVRLTAIEERLHALERRK